MSLPWTADQAFAFAKVANNFQNWHDDCGMFVAMAHGYGGSGWNTALEQGQAAVLHQGPAPLGACHYWDGGAGHTAIEAGNGKIWTNDLGVDGKITLEPFADVARKWGKNWIGWAHPDSNTFRQSWGTNPYFTPPAPTPPKPTPPPVPPSRTPLDEDVRK